MAVTNMQLLERLGHLNVRLNVDVNREMSEAGGLSLSRYRVLRFIEARSPTHAGDIRSFFDFAPRTVTEALDGLERDGLISRRRASADRRMIDIAILPAGTDILRVSAAPLFATADRVFGALTMDEKDMLDRLLADVLEACDAA